MSRPIEDYGLIGNMVSAALVARDGSIDWLCLPHFDSPACFAALLGTADHGRWKIAPTDQGTRITRRYLPDTAVIETTFETSTGAVTLTDFMPFGDDDQKVDVVRIVRGTRGEVDMSMELVLRFNYGQALPWVRRRDYGLSAIAGPDAIELHTGVPLEGRDMKTYSAFTVREGDSLPFVLSYHPSYKSPQFVADHSESLAKTVSWWREWSSHCNIAADAKWRDAVVRSLITLKLLVFAPTGGIIAAPTTSLPEWPGHHRNWDYRYCWLRDSALTLYALLNAGYREEADAWRGWLLRATAGHPRQMQIMYSITGDRWLPEQELIWLPGYANSQPVRIGNAAAGQMQLDVYGELIDTLHAAREAKLAPSEDAWRVERTMLEQLAHEWQNPDHGIWEMRSPAQCFTHSRLMSWVAFDRAIKGVEHFKLKGPVDNWRTLRDRIHRQICERAYDPGLQSFTQVYGSRDVDAALLLIPQLGFLPPDDPRVVGTVAQIEKTLMVDGLVRRYAPEHTDDGIQGQEGVFLACSYWLADCYVLQSRFDDAAALFERLLGLRNDLGLLAEEYDPVSRRLVGNFPQAFSHVGLINTAYNLLQAQGPARQRAKRNAPPDAKAESKRTG